ncbi:MAG: dolichyl-phosphate hexose transferase [Halobacteria archaeon]|nr:dolichyl-phosphate hexose transferase [Halobacteria archaeon]
MSREVEIGTQDEDSNAPEEYTFNDVSVVMGTYNEEKAIRSVLRDIKGATDEKAEIVCVDGSSDRTPDIARELGAKVIRQEPQGYGVAVREAILTPDREVIITTDCDDTYPMERLPDFLEYINQGYDVVSGDRITKGAEEMPRLNEFGNRAFVLLASLLTGKRFYDTTTGMRAYRRDVVRGIDWTENTGLSAELLIRPAMRGYKVKEIPIEYSERKGETKLNPFTGGAAIAKSIVKVSLEERFNGY